MWWYPSPLFCLIWPDNTIKTMHRWAIKINQQKWLVRYSFRRRDWFIWFCWILTRAGSWDNLFRKFRRPNANRCCRAEWKVVMRRKNDEFLFGSWKQQRYGWYVARVWIWGKLVNLFKKKVVINIFIFRLNFDFNSRFIVLCSILICFKTQKYYRKIRQQVFE